MDRKQISASKKRNNRSRKKLVRRIVLCVIPLIILCLFAVIVMAFSGFLDVHYAPEKTLLSAANIWNEMPYEKREYICFDDPLKYVSGYEVLIADVPIGKWTLPQAWQAELISPAQIEERHDVAFSLNAVNELSELNLPSTYQAYFFYENGRNGDTIYDWEFIVGLYADETLILYRGFNLYGDMDLM